MKNLDAIQLSEQLLLAVKKHEPTFKIAVHLELMPEQKLSDALDSDARRLAFWLNLYNAFFQILRTEHKLGRPDIFRKRAIKIAGKSVSLDDIEHGILRRNRLKWGLGYLPDPFVRPFVRKMAVSKLDFRVHFALNCGARSCPPIAFFSPEKIERQLDMAMHAFLESETEVFPEKKEVNVSRLFQWFRGDFGGEPGIRRILAATLGDEVAAMRIGFRDYDWSEQLDNFTAPN